jgi:hypothetical protein
MFKVGALILRLGGDRFKVEWAMLAKGLPDVGMGA